MKKWLLILIILGAIILTYLLRQNFQSAIPEIKTVTVNNQIIAVEIADTPAERKQGLSGRASLPTGTGLLFIFNEQDYHSFWMKEMNFPIDILWLDDDFKIVDAWINAEPSSYPKTFIPKNKTRYVLETNPGEIATSTYPSEWSTGREQS